MRTEPSLSDIYRHSENVVARKIQEEFIIIPIHSGVASGEELFSLNDSGKAVWDKLDGKRTLKDIVEKLSIQFEASKGVLDKDILGITKELLKRKMIVKSRK